MSQEATGQVFPALLWRALGSNKERWSEQAYVAGWPFRYYNQGGLRNITMQAMEVTKSSLVATLKQKETAEIKSIFI